MYILRVHGEDLSESGQVVVDGLDVVLSQSIISHEGKLLGERSCWNIGCSVLGSIDMLLSLRVSLSNSVN